MVKRKRKKSDLEKAFIAPFAVGTFGVATGALVTPTSGLLPAGVVNPLSSISASASRFAGPIGTIGFTGVALKKLKEFEKIKPKKKRSKK